MEEKLFQQQRGGIPHDKLSAELFNLARGVILDLIDEQFGGSGTLKADRIADGRKRGSKVFGNFNIVKTDHADILRNTVAAGVQSPDTAEGALVIGCDKGGRHFTCTSPAECVDYIIGDQLLKKTVHNIFVRNRQAKFFHGVQKTALAFQTVIDIFGKFDKCNFAVPELNQIFCGSIARLIRIEDDAADVLAAVGTIQQNCFYLIVLYKREVFICNPFSFEYKNSVKVFSENLIFDDGVVTADNNIERIAEVATLLAQGVQKGNEIIAADAGGEESEHVGLG